MEAINHNQRGIKAEEKGKISLALEEFSESLRINSSIENTEGIIVALVNSSRVYRHNGDAKAALAMIKGAIPLVKPHSPLYSEVAFEMAQVMLFTGELNEASGWAARAAEAEIGAQRGMRFNLQARILYLNGNLPEAEKLVLEALSLNRSASDRVEEANSLRLLGDILAVTNRQVDAAESYNQALAIDKNLGRSRKIAADLRALALLSLSQNDPDQALVYYQRAFAVSSGGGDHSGAADDQLKMSRINELFKKEHK
jgi:tetratricopeptide (TPR) repeat protein